PPLALPVDPGVVTVAHMADALPRRAAARPDSRDDLGHAPTSLARCSCGRRWRRSFEVLQPAGCKEVVPLTPLIALSLPCKLKTVFAHVALKPRRQRWVGHESHFVTAEQVIQIVPHRFDVETECAWELLRSLGEGGALFGGRLLSRPQYRVGGKERSPSRLAQIGLRQYPLRQSDRGRTYEPAHFGEHRRSRHQSKVVHHDESDIPARKDTLGPADDVCTCSVPHRQSR